MFRDKERYLNQTVSCSQVSGVAAASGRGSWLRYPHPSFTPCGVCASRAACVAAVPEDHSVLGVLIAACQERAQKSWFRCKPTRRHPWQHRCDR